MSEKRDTYQIVDLVCPFGRKLAKKFGEDLARDFICFLRKEGLPIEFPAKMVDGITLAGSPEVKLELLDGQGNTIDANNKGVAARHRFLVTVDGKPQLTLKSIKIPKLDYNKTGCLKIKLTYYCMADEGMARRKKEQRVSGHK